MTSYRYPNEQLILFATIGLMLLVAAFAAIPTFCLAPLGVVVLVAMAYQLNQQHHRALMANALPVSRQRTPQLAAIVEECVQRLRPGSVEFFVVGAKAINAYTFGFSPPQTIVLYEPLLQVMDRDELKFIIGHELGHVALGHVWVNTLLGGMGGIPVSIGAALVVTLAFRSWNRSSEYSCDRAGLLACGRPDKAVSAMIKLVSGGRTSPEDMEQALRTIEAEDDSPINVLAESFSTHPMLVRRIAEIKKFAGSQQYAGLLQSIEQRMQRA